MGYTVHAPRLGPSKPGRRAAQSHGASRVSGTIAILVYREQTIGDDESRKLATLQSELLAAARGRDKLLRLISLGPKRSEEPTPARLCAVLKSVRTHKTRPGARKCPTCCKRSRTPPPPPEALDKTRAAPNAR